VGRTHPLTTQQRAELAMLLSLLVLPYPDAIVHHWPQPLPASWTGQFDQAQPGRYIQVQPTVVADIEADTAYETWRWHHVWYRRPRHTYRCTTFRFCSARTTIASRGRPPRDAAQAE
jgi:hypothetical protein